MTPEESHAIAMGEKNRHGLAARKSVRTGSDGPKTVADSSVTLAHIMGPNDTNLYGSVHGGVIMKLVDDAAAASAARHANGPAVTASIDGMTFVHPAYVGDLLRVDAQLAHAGRTSMDVVVEVSAQRWNESGQDRDIVRAFLTFVAVDADGRPRQVPALVTMSDQEKSIADEALERRRKREEDQPDQG